MNLLGRLSVCALLAWFSLPVLAGGGTAKLSAFDLEVVQTPTFLRYHPDIRWRLDGLSELERGQVDVAFEHFRRASLYGDKVSQGIVAEMYWQGQGTSQDRALAYAWMDLAAERGYPVLLGKREQYWAALTETERTQSITVGQAVYREFGDDAALPRLTTAIKQGRRSVTGSRAGGSAGVRTIYPGGPADSVEISAMVIQFSEVGGSSAARGNVGTVKISSGRPQVSGGKEIHRMWSDRFWKTEQYLAWKEIELDGGLGRRGVVDVLPLRTLED